MSVVICQVKDSKVIPNLFRDPTCKVLYTPKYGMLKQVQHDIYNHYSNTFSLTINSGNEP